MAKKEKYDFICSLGGNCAPAHNLRYRNLRTASYPFDWTYFTSEEAVYKLADSFKDGFRNYMLKENLKELPKNPSHPERIQYEDTYGKMVWANHFNYTKNADMEYERVKSTFDKRFKRLIEAVEQSERIMFIFSTSFFIGEAPFEYLLKTLNELYKDKKFQIKVLSFSCENNEIINKDNLEIMRYTRDMNDYDYGQSNYEWSFLDKIQLTKQKRNKKKFNLFKYKIKVEWSR